MSALTLLPLEAAGLVGRLLRALTPADRPRHDWAILIAPDGGEASVCYHDAATMRERARWYLAPGRSEMRDGDCPSE